MRSSAPRGPGTSSQWKAIAHWQRIDNLLCQWTIHSCWYTLLNIFNVSSTQNQFDHRLQEVVSFVTATLN